MSIVMQWMIGSSITALLIITLRYLLQRRVKATWLYGLWLILIIRLICPYLPTSQISLLHAIKPSEKVVTRNIETIQDTVQEEVSAQSLVDSPIKEQSRGEVVQPSVEDISAKDILQSATSLNTPTAYVMPIDIKQVAKIVWGMGMIGVILYFAYVDRKFRKELKALNPIDEHQIIGLIESYNKQLGIRRKMDVKWGDTPMSYGIIKPIIILPTGYEKQELEGIFMHEMMHHKYGDILINFLQVIILSVHWFNPLVWFAIYLMKQDAELACDERVLKQLENRQIYAKVLLQVSDQSHSHYLAGSYMSFGKKQLKRRIVAMSKMKKQGFIWGSLIIVCGIVVSVVCLTNPGKKVEPANSVAVIEKEQPEEAKTIWNQINKIEFTNSVQKVEVSPSGKYAYILDDEPSATFSKQKDKIYVLTDEGQVSVDCLDFLKKSLAEEYDENDFGNGYNILEQKYGWVNKDGKEVFELYTVVTGGDGWDNHTARKTEMMITVDPTQLDNIAVWSDTKTVGEQEFELTEKEQALYEEYISTKDVQVLKDITPIEGAKIIINCNLNGDIEELYPLTITTESKEMFTLNSTSMVFKFRDNKKVAHNTYGLIDEATVIEGRNGTVDLEYEATANDRVRAHTLRLKKVDNVWRILSYYVN